MAPFNHASATPRSLDVRGDVCGIRKSKKRTDEGDKHGDFLNSVYKTIDEYPKDVAQIGIDECLLCAWPNLQVV